ncbi:MAG: ATP-binding protein [Candidatus Omnitrophica bacterium]|nr:ATP-binding protein [Candidatus Omnitrophota bacterium]
MERIERIKFILKEANPWWRQPNYRVENYGFREVFSVLKRFFSLPQILALVGLRRTGKTTLLLKTIEIFLEKLNSKNILYFSFDDFWDLDLEEVMLAYKEIFPEKELKKERFLFCFDEIQKLENWQEKLKRLYDLYPNIKIVISGSESLFIRKLSKESLAGRLFEFKISPLNFKEYIIFTKKELILKNPELYKEEILRLYQDFLKTNGFPELANTKDSMVIHRYVRDLVIDKIIFKDIPQIFKVKNIDVLLDILENIIFFPGQLIDITKLSKELQITRQVVSAYLDYLEKSFLIKKLYNFSKNLRKTKRSLKKYYPRIIFPSLVEENFSLSFENSLIWQLDAQFFYRDSYKNEVDIVLIGKNKNILPIEIKTGKIEFRGISYFIKRYKPKEAIIITLNKEEKQGKIRIIPFYKYLLKEI